MTKSIDIKVPPEFWASSIMPEGVLEKWLQPDRGQVEAGDAIAVVRIEGMLHKLLAPCAGTLQTTCKANSVIDPGFVVGRVQPRLDA
jgi:hypothetical protein